MERLPSRVLLVDNHAEFTSVVVPAFLSAHEVTAVGSIAAAKAALSSAPAFDVVLTDFDLDDGKGPELLAWLHERPTFPPAIAISSHEAGNTALTLAGARAVCSKLRFHEIGAVLDEVARSTRETDIWGSLYRDHHEGRAHPYVIERDDGLAHEIPSAADYFTAPRSELERQYLDALEGPVLDVGAGAGSHALYLEARGLEVTAIDSSVGAIEVCRRRGCRDARVMDVRSLALEAGRHASIIVMGNTLGIHQTPETFPRLFHTLAAAARSEARLFCVTRDPLETTAPEHLLYQQRNRDQGRPPGLSLIRLRYRDLLGTWTPLWMPTRDELRAAAAPSGWSIVDERPLGPNRFRLLAR